SRVGLSGIHLDLGLQQPETSGQHGFPLRACGNDEAARRAGWRHRQVLIKQRIQPIGWIFCV
ncbi:hypothetical protein, partial [Halomonas sp. 3F2F]|uniref:hypothetical protein n=1 Tax=Halomonas sp. 3F2F TaxID=1255602 RepID=UPI001D01501A